LFEKKNQKKKNAPIKAADSKTKKALRVVLHLLDMISDKEKNSFFQSIT